MAGGGRSARLVRALRLARRLEGVRVSPSFDALAEEMGVCARTVRRDWYALEEAGWRMPPLRLYPDHAKKVSGYYQTEHYR